MSEHGNLWRPATLGCRFPDPPQHPAHQLAWLARPLLILALVVQIVTHVSRWTKRQDRSSKTYRLSRRLTWNLHNVLLPHLIGVSEVLGLPRSTIWGKRLRLLMGEKGPGLRPASGCWHLLFCCCMVPPSYISTLKLGVPRSGYTMGLVEVKFPSEFQKETAFETLPSCKFSSSSIPFLSGCWMLPTWI